MKTVFGSSLKPEMLQNLRIIHRRKPHVFAETDFPIWRTCLRSLAFPAPDDRVEAEANDHVFAGEDAYRFLLEVVCGLHSPILGETEVFGQFKIFAADWKAAQPHCANLIQRVLADAKAVRTQYLSGLGAQSYGGWLKKHVSAATLHVIGGGQLAHEVAPYLQKRAQRVHVHVRRPSAVALSGVQVHELRAQAFCDGGLVIAAPISAAEVKVWLNGQEPQEIFDLRETSETDPIHLGHVIGLNTIFSELEKTKRRLEPLIEKVKCEIRQRSIRLAEDIMVRPLGWDDICA